MNVAIIPARGGSKRIPQKNIRDFCGKPMIAWSIEAARASNCFERIIVSTDDDAVAAVAHHYGAEIPFLRPAELAGDHVGLEDVVRHALSWLIDHDIPVSYFCCLFATAPFLTGASLREGLTLLQKAPQRYYAVSVTSFPFPVQRAIRMTPNDLIEPLYPDYMAMRSQDLEEAYHEAGQFFWGRPEAFHDHKGIYSPGASIPVRIPRYRVQDIDTMEDWKRAELMFSALQNDKEEAHEHCLPC